MKLPPLVPGRLIKRYKRFLADIEFSDGSMITAHCANPGSMMGLAMPGSRVWLSVSDNPKRKLSHSWELVEVGGVLVGVSTARPNALVEEAILVGAIAELSGYATLRREVKYGKNSRVDILLEDPERPTAYVEVKNVNLMREPGLAEFPDAVTARGAKHLVELGDMVAAGHRAVMVYLVQYPGAERFALARDIDPAYGEAFDIARSRGVEAVAIVCEITQDEIRAARPIPVLG
ncbi:sugar fermentation stimulation protein A [Breoghania corrubedonensis]|uniref:Sugar fermentation stimulation protein homolog n=1 Tax=Breoghania corrubedonensis TaxID=665038 RepID=A0A2T5VD22_9HYPH|nr:DNA/RNA nuclease SfsA [Breoghania corrubedonensis]PTW61667.1 sugar fermentation stimulation protein A [Breoghania corrubedonensis]